MVSKVSTISLDVLLSFVGKLNDNGDASKRFRENISKADCARAKYTESKTKQDAKFLGMKLFYFHCYAFLLLECYG
jgi:hypothetical protein